MKHLIKLSIASLLTAALFSGAFTQTPAKQKLNVAILIFDGVQIIDYTGPYEVLGSRGRRNVYTVAENADPITTNMGMKVIPNYTFANQPKPDIIVLPGGGNIQTGENGRGVGAQLENQNVINWIKENAKDAKYVMSVCNGAFFLAKAGLLENLPATTTAGFISSLPKFSPTTKPVYDKRFVDNGKIITTAGLSAGIDGALHLLEKLDGPGWAKATALGIEYNWQPDSDYTRASLADVKLPNNLGNVLTSASEPIDMKGDRRDWEEKWVIPTEMSATDMLASIEKEWSGEKGWSKTGADRSRTKWKFTDESGQIWNGWATAEPASETGKLLVSFGITADKKKAGE